tara:strand:- start:1626 stop:2090 length:465 start_codon:yes stop_codon:yes gene_type:complete
VNTLICIKFKVVHAPVPQPRQRFRVITPKNKPAMVHNYTPAKHPVQDYKRAVLDAFQNVYDGEPLLGPLSLKLVFAMPRPKRLIWKRRPMVHEWFNGRADRDNLQKSFMDALNGVAWKDDRQVVSGPVDVIYAAGNEEPYTSASLRTLTEKPQV